VSTKYSNVALIAVTKVDKRAVTEAAGSSYTKKLEISLVIRILLKKCAISSGRIIS